MGALSIRKSLCVLKVESSVGTWNAPSSSDAKTRIYRNGDSPVLRVNRDFEPIEAQGRTGTDGGIPGLGTSALAGFIHLHGKGASGLPDQSKLWAALGMAFDGTNSYTTSDDSSTWSTLSAAEYIDGIWTPARGIMLDGSIELAVGKAARFNFTGVGGLKSPASSWSDTTLITGVSYESVTPPIWASDGTNNAFVLGTNVLKPSLCTVALNRSPSMREDTSSNSYAGVLCGWLNPTAPQITIDVESDLRGTLNWDALFEAGTEQTLTATVGFGANNSIQLVASRCQVMQYPNFGNRNSKVTRPITLQVNGTVTLKYQ